MTKKEFAPVTPGEMLKEEFLAKYGLSQKAPDHWPYFQSGSHPIGPFLTCGPCA